MIYNAGLRELPPLRETKRNLLNSSLQCSQIDTGGTVVRNIYLKNDEKNEKIEKSGKKVKN